MSFILPSFSFIHIGTGCELPTNNCKLIYGVACGPGFPLIRAQALGARPVSASLPNAGKF
ncbi:hypothetical protein [Mucilaginibacter aquariorum]|uniref:Uncharacterized protein n=1 Tax=Mucilaginibacter aquariorum TaxID=2967225 RepID=A0ABT1T5E0_9SPHI|nr:hypothetical protein [Mucilaginibacter aquariorum]MCQ6959600.1 hypothetical protein [Mucilaginibacter aquariorum]